MNIYDRILHQAKRIPDAVAARHGQDSLSYGELDMQSAQFARALIGRGVRPGDRVGLCIERGLMIPVSILGVIRAGAAYVPLDPSYPMARLEYMVRDSDPRLVVVTEGNLPDLEGTCPILSTARLLAESEEGPEASLDDLIDPENPAYIIYTSGSTGKPKGVVLPHQALMNLLDWQLEDPRFDQPGVTLQFAPLGFDAHYHEIFSALPAGGSLVMVDETMRLDPFRLLPFMKEEGVERIFLPFVALQQLAEVGISFGIIPETLKEVVTAGERLQVTDSLREFFSRIPDCKLHNHYGPSETHVVTTYTLPDDRTQWPVLPPIGHPLTNVVAYILDKDLNPVAKGEAGELCFSGVCVAHGYWGREDLTAERFLPDPNGHGSMYRTGDLGREDSQGEIEFLGRIDDQIKIRGHRVELGEVEAGIMRHPAVSECAAYLIGEGAGDKTLGAFLVLDSHRPEVGSDVPAMGQEKLEAWRDVWDNTYEDTEARDQAQSDEMSGWRSSYDGSPLTRSEMEAWADETVARILARKPRRLLEMGCGGGLILSRVAPKVEAFTGVDFSKTAIETLRAQYSESPPCPEFSLEVGAAHESRLYSGSPFDTVVLNSVTQHFPSHAYLFEVLDTLFEMVPEGQIFLGDVANRALREAFFLSVEDFRAGDHEALADVQGRVDRRMGEEQEMSIHPAFFHRLQERYPSLRAVETRLKAGPYQNELSNFRYDVWLTVGRKPAPEVDVQWESWEESGLDLESLRTRLRENPDLLLGLTGIPNKRVHSAVTGTRLLRGKYFETAGDWREERAQQSPETFDPQDFWALQEDFQGVVHVDWSQDPGNFDVLFRPAADQHAIWRPGWTFGERPWTLLTTNPLNAALFPSVVREVRAELESFLPEYMVPTQFGPMARLPRTPSGKLARDKLPPPDRRRVLKKGSGKPPQGETELALAGIWEELLGVDGVSVDDSFFDLGGNSILTVKLVVLIRKKMAKELPLVMLFEHPTIQKLAAYLNSDSDDQDEAPRNDSQRASKQRRAFSRARDARRKK